MAIHMKLVEKLKEFDNVVATKLNSVSKQGILKVENNEDDIIKAKLETARNILKIYKNEHKQLSEENDKIGYDTVIKLEQSLMESQNTEENLKKRIVELNNEVEKSGKKLVTKKQEEIDGVTVIKEKALFDLIEGNKKKSKEYEAKLQTIIKDNESKEKRASELEIRIEKLNEEIERLKEHAQRYRKDETEISEDDVTKEQQKTSHQESCTKCGIACRPCHNMPSASKP